MLVLSRKLGEKLCIGDDIIVTVTKTTGSRVSIGIEAPREVPIRRSEIVVERDDDVEAEVAYDQEVSRTY